MKVSELKAKIREEILSTLNEDEWQQEVGSQYHSSLYNEQEDVDVDVDVDDEVEVGLSPKAIEAAMDASIALGNDKLADQIGNTITFFTREYVVGQNTD